MPSVKYSTTRIFGYLCHQAPNVTAPEPGGDQHHPGLHQDALCPKGRHPPQEDQVRGLERGQGGRDPRGGARAGPPAGAAGRERTTATVVTDHANLTTLHPAAPHLMTLPEKKYNYLSTDRVPYSIE